jgi:hypothetical protein
MNATTPWDYEASGRGQPVPVCKGRAVPTPRFIGSHLFSKEPAHET